MADSSNQQSSPAKGKKWTFGRRLRCFLAGLVIFTGIFLLAAFACLDPIIRTAVSTVGSRVTGTPVTLGGINLSLLRGSLELVDFSIGNPEGYNTATLMHVGRIYVKLAPLSLFSRTIRVEAVEIAEPSITYEVGLGNSNLGAVLQNIGNFTGGGKEEASASEGKPSGGGDEAVEEKGGGGRKVVIDRVSVSGGSVQLSAKLMQGVAVPVPLPPITLHDLGKEKEGMSIAEASGEILKSIFSAASDLAVKTWSGLLDIGKATGKAVGEAGKAVGRAIGDAAEAVKEIFTK